MIAEPPEDAPTAGVADARPTDDEKGAVDAGGERTNAADADPEIAGPNSL